MSLLQKLGAAPNVSFRYFLIGLLCFIIGIAIFFSSEYVNELKLAVSLTFIGIGCLLAIWGYLGIFSARLLTMMNRHPATKKDKH